jgi:hypothetical protein
MRTEGRPEMTKLIIVAFRNFANSLKNDPIRPLVVVAQNYRTFFRDDIRLCFGKSTYNKRNHSLHRHSYVFTKMSLTSYMFLPFPEVIK